MKVVTHPAFREVYTQDPAAAPGRIECIVEAIQDLAQWVEAAPATREDVALVHTERHIHRVAGLGLEAIALLAAGGTIQAAHIGLEEPAFALVRPPGHHASADRSWGFCYFNNVAVALEHLRHRGHIRTAYVLDFDLHYGDGTVNILRDKGYAAILNPQARDRKSYLETIEKDLEAMEADIVAVSAGFDQHQQDWGGLLLTQDYEAIGGLVRAACRRRQIGCFGALEGGYNHQVLGKNVRAFLKGLER